MSERQQYTCPDCGAIGAGATGMRYKCHMCTYKVIMQPSNNGRILCPCRLRAPGHSTGWPCEGKCTYYDCP